MIFIAEILSKLHMGRVVKVKRSEGGETLAHVVGFTLNPTGETIVVVQAPRKQGESWSIDTIGYWTETFATHPSNITIFDEE